VANPHDKVRATITNPDCVSKFRAQLRHFHGLVNKCCPQTQSGSLKSEALVTSAGFDPVGYVIDLGVNYGDGRRALDVSVIFLILVFGRKRALHRQRP
jgi:hypothetical protein